MATYNDKFPEVPDPLEHSTPLFHKMKILTIFGIYRLQFGKLVYESISNNSPSQIIFTTSEIHTHDTRYASRGNFYSNYARTSNYGLKSLHI